MTVTLYQGDCVAWAREYSGDPFHALLCDPPYEMAFMGRKWDASGVAFDPATWAAFLPILHPGAFGMAFASSRGWHRLACAIEDAGFVIHPSIFLWTYATGFPKATRINHGDPNTETFKGHRYGLQALKPAAEPIIVFQKPYEGRPVENITRTGAGVLNVDGGRISVDEIEPNKRRDTGGYASGKSAAVVSNAPYNKTRTATLTEGRWPANFVLDEEAARRLDAQSGERGNGHFPKSRGDGRGTSMFGLDKGEQDERYLIDSGGASRFFFNVREQLDEADPVRYVAKASRRERDAGLEGFEEKPRFSGGLDGASIPLKGSPMPVSRNPHPTVKPLALAQYLATLLLPPVEYAPRRIFVPFAGAGSECIGSMQAGWEEVVGVELTEEYIPIAEARVEHWSNQPRQMEIT